MKKFIALIIVVFVIAGGLFLSYSYLTIRKGSDFYFMKKDPGTFEEVYVDVSHWGPKDYVLNPKISAFLAMQGVKNTGKKFSDKVEEGWEKTKDAVSEGAEKTKEAVEDGVEKAKEKLDGE